MLRLKTRLNAELLHRSAMAGNRATLRVWLSALPVPQMRNEPLPSPALVATRGEFLLRHDWRLLNNGSFGACPRPVFAAYQRCR